MLGTYGCFKVSIFPKIEKKNAPNFEIVFRRTAKIGAFLLEVSVGQVSEPSEFSCFLKEADRLLH